MRDSIHFVSDLHLFSRRSRAEDHIEELHAAASMASVFVLGGDIFDFKWSHFPSAEHTADAAAAWLHELIVAHELCEFHFVLGNHDCHPAMVSRLTELSSEAKNLNWHPYYLRLEDMLFLHGDVADWPTTQQKLELKRARWNHDKNLGEIRNLIYDAAVATRMHKLVNLCLHRDELVAKRLLHYLEDIGHGPASGVRQVYFGHTHRAMNGFQAEGVSFHNGGAPFLGLDFRVLRVELPDVSRHVATA